MTGHIPRPEILSEPQRRRHWVPAEKLAMVEVTYAPGVTVSLVARRNGIQPNQLFTWRKLAAQGGLTATSAQEEVVAASEFRALQDQVRELQRLLGKKMNQGPRASRLAPSPCGSPDLPSKHFPRSASKASGKTYHRRSSSACDLFTTIRRAGVHAEGEDKYLLLNSTPKSVNNQR